MTTTSAAHPAHGAQGFLLLLLNNVEAILPGIGRVVDQLALECVTLPDNPSSLLSTPERDVWLVLRVGSNEKVISPTQVVRHLRADRTFIFEDSPSSVGTDSRWMLKLPLPQEIHDVEDLDTFEVILSQYAAVEEVDPSGPPPAYSYPGAQDGTSLDTPASQPKRPVPPPPVQSRFQRPPLPPRTISSEKREKEDNDFRGRLVLVDEEDGEIVGTLGDQFNIQEDNALRAKGHEKDPVIVDIPGEAETDQSIPVYVHPVPIEQQDALMKTASLISRGIVLATDAVTTGMGAASSLYIKHSKPSEKPLEFSERTRGHVRRVHSISGKAVAVTAKTTGLIHEAIEHAIDYVSGSNKGKGKAGERTTTSTPPTPGAPPPPLPLRNRVFLSTDMLLTTVEQSAKQLIEHGTLRVSDALGHKYGKDMRDASLMVGHTARNVGVVYIDARGVGRRALLKKAGARYVKAKLGKKDVVLGIDERGILQEAQRSPSPSGSLPFSRKINNSGFPPTGKT